MRLLRRGFIALLSILIIACTPIWQTKSNDVDPQSLSELRTQKINQLTRWKIRGRTVILQDKEGVNVGLKWQEDNGRYIIKLEGPFSQGGVTLKGDENTVTLTTSDGQYYSANTPEELIEKVIGWNLPVSALRDWVRGLPSSEQEITSIEYNDKGQLTHLVQGEWEIQFLRYIPFEDMSMPGKVFIKHPELSVKLIIADWDRP